MGTTSLAREQLNEAMEQFANKIMEVLRADALDEETGEPELTGTHFKAVDADNVERVVDAESFSVGTLIADGPFEYFRCIPNGGATGPWIRYTGDTYTHAKFAEEMRSFGRPPRIVHEG